MLPKRTIHFVNDKQLCEEQYANYRERSGKERGYVVGKEAGIREVVEWGNEPCSHIKEFLKRDCDLCRQAKLKEWGIKEEKCKQSM